MRITKRTRRTSVPANYLPYDVIQYIFSKIHIIRFQHSLCRYFTKRGMVHTAKLFQKEANFPLIPQNLFDAEKDDFLRFIKFLNRQPRSKLMEREVVLEKVLSKSDCGKGINGAKACLLIPKCSEIRTLLPLVSDDGIELPCQDEQGQIYKFLYCYTENKRTYAFRGDWALYVARNKLTSGDIVTVECDLADSLFIKCHQVGPVVTHVSRCKVLYKETVNVNKRGGRVSLTMDDKPFNELASDVLLHGYMVEKGWYETALALQREAGYSSRDGNITVFRNVESNLKKWWNYYQKQFALQRIIIFTKILSRSDCLKHLVVPKRSKGIDCLPNPKESSEGIEVLVENEGRTYQFMYCYRKSKCAFIMGGEWKQFVTQKGLQHGDRIILQRDENDKYVMACKKTC